MFVITGLSRVYFRPLPGGGMCSTVVVLGRRSASETGMIRPVRASRPRRSGAGFGGVFWDAMLKLPLQSIPKIVECRGDEPRVQG